MKKLLLILFVFFVTTNVFADFLNFFKNNLS